MVLSPVPMLLAFVGGSAAFPSLVQLVVALLASVACFACGLTLFRKPAYGKLAGSVAAVASFIAGGFYIIEHPFVALSSAVSLILLLFVLFDFRVDSTAGLNTTHVDRCLLRTRWAAYTLPLVVFFALVLVELNSPVVGYVIVIATIITLSLYAHWANASGVVGKQWVPILAGVFVLWCLLNGQNVIVAIAGCGIAILALWTTPRYRRGSMIEADEHWWDLFLTHPARILFSTFLLLSVLGTLLLLIPAATSNGSILLVDAVFTAVSAVCVTGLVVLDTPIDFTFFGQAVIAFLIQIGGLGIMTITTVALQAMGKRLSLRHERVLTNMSDTSHNTLTHSLSTILKFTFVVEGTGAVLLTMFFLFSGDTLSEASWRGIFTAISAFCNAGFAIQSNSMVDYNGNPMILHTVSTMIVLGGMAPATSLIVPDWIKGNPIPMGARIALITMVVLLVVGFFGLLTFEWNGMFKGMSLAQKVNNAWFQSVSFRTAGFASVDVAHMTNPSFLLMLVFMFIGGSPGGTAGGIKTTTVALIMMTFWAHIRNQQNVVFQHRRVDPNSIYRAISVVVAGIGLMFVVVLMLEVTQNLSSHDLIFEAVSALGTVGLSTGITPMLDEIGKVIVTIAMFLGRIGPLTLFMLLSGDQTVRDDRHPTEKISVI